MESNICEMCGAEKTLIPGGVSKRTGKPYKSFMACPNKCKVAPKNPRPDNSQQVMEALIGISKQIENLNERMTGLAKFLKDKFQ